ncbi:MAG TPA: L,D-transpeptidase family protein [Chthoniobacterales bacterium]|nr:L,D-transpeptidase family protein [Chthoniobacterales bacterium]
MKLLLIVLLVICLVTAGLAAAAYLNVSPLPRHAVADRIVVEKAARRLTLFRNGEALKSYSVALGRAPVGAKEQEGDQRTPEGIYKVDFHKPDSDYHLALHISYPEQHDIDRAAVQGLSAGSDIMIHGLPNGRGWIGRFHRRSDWTAGCIAVADFEIEEIYRAVPDGTPIELRP